jgi:hypothetical protein
MIKKEFAAPVFHHDARIKFKVLFDMRAVIYFGVFYIVKPNDDQGMAGFQAASFG